MQAPSVEISVLTADGKAYPPQDNLILPKGTTSLHLEFAAPALKDTGRVHFRYRLDGVDKDWQDAQERRDASYTNLSPGAYQFHVVAANEDRVWSRGATLNLRVEPFFVQTMGFRILCVAFVIAAAYSVYCWRLRQQCKVIEARMEARHQERERVARSLHDTLLQGLHGTVLLMDAAMQNLDKDSAARQPLEQAVGHLENVLAAGRDEIVGLRSAMSGYQCLAESLEAVGKRLEQSSPASFRMDLRGQPWPVDENVCDQFFAIGREAIVNAFQHADAKQIVAVLDISGEQLDMSIVDDGKGIDCSPETPSVRTGHWGLINMRERSAQIGAKLSIQAHSGKGSEIRLLWRPDTASKKLEQSRSISQVFNS